MNTVSLNGVVHKLRESDGLELEALKAMAGLADTRTENDSSFSVGFLGRKIAT